MFTGIVTDIGTVTAVEQRGDLREQTLASALLGSSLRLIPAQLSLRLTSRDTGHYWTSCVSGIPSSRCISSIVCSSMRSLVIMSPILEAHVSIICCKHGDSDTSCQSLSHHRVLRHVPELTSRKPTIPMTIR